MIELLGYLGGIIFAICALPQSIQSYKEGHSRGVNALFLWLWLFGELITFIYVYLKHGVDIPLFLNYTVNIILILFIIRYKYWERLNED